MSRSLSYLRRGLLGIALAGALGFGATTALAAPDTAARKPNTCIEGTVSCYCWGGLLECVDPGLCDSCGY